MCEEKIVLKPCPFCGSEARTGKSVMSGHYAILCKNNSCNGILEHFETEFDAIETWNTRKGDTPS